MMVVAAGGVVVRVMPKFLHDFEHPHGSPATPNFKYCIDAGAKTKTKPCATA